jgi:prolipoprotein diacylglyceryltransferase
MYPDPLFYIQGYPIYFFVIDYGIGFVLACALAAVLTRERNIPLKHLFVPALACIAADLALTPVVVWVMEQFNLAVPLNWSFGQIIAVLTALVAYHVTMGRRVPAPFSERLDILAPPVVLFIAILRLACLAAGCCYGLPAPGLPWAITFTNPHAISIYKNIPVHPTELYESVGALAILGLLLALRRRAMWRGNLMWLALLSYAAIRFVIEFYRGDPRPMMDVLSFVLSFNQLVCVAMAAVCGSLLVRRLYRQSIIGMLPAANR